MFSKPPRPHLPSLDLHLHFRIHLRARLPGPDEIDMLARTHIGLERGRTSDAR